jgi:phosphoribosyl-ATP pyrophosphohydrolase
MESIFHQLMKTIEQRKNASSETSYTAKLMHSGTHAINKKIIEEAYETCVAGCGEDVSALTHEICDLIYHTFVLAGFRGVSYEMISDELSRRFGTSGIAEKASRSAS